MTPALADLSPPRAALLCAVPLVYALAALAPGRVARDLRTGWRMARWGAALAVMAALMSLAWLLASQAGLARGPELWTLGRAGALRLSLRSDPLGCTMLLLVTFIGWVITGYSQPYLDAERGQQRYLRGLLLTLAAVSLLVLTNNLLVLAGAWIVTSLALHGLLTFFEQRPQALIAAHKKFLASRVADLCLLGGIALLGTTLGTLEIDQAIAAAQALGRTPPPLQAAALLLACSALLKCAQLPVHGWLIQVMEAPTPVSALLHAGVVNLGGFLLIRLSTLVTGVPAAQALLVVVGSVTAVVAALVMTTRISIKVALAWSTCAQMGFMMMECGLGLHDLALLHLVAHSLYKAHAFLCSGGAVELNRLQQLTPPPAAPRPLAWLLGALLSLGLVGSAAALCAIPVARAPALWAMAAILSMALVPMLAAQVVQGGGRWRWVGLLAGFGVALAYFGLHLAASHWLGAPDLGGAASPGLVTWVLACFGVLFAVQASVRIWPHGALARQMYPWLFAGLYLDELFTRLTFRVWPARLPAANAGMAWSAATITSRTPGTR